MKRHEVDFGSKGRREARHSACLLRAKKKHFKNLIRARASVSTRFPKDLVRWHAVCVALRAMPFDPKECRRHAAHCRQLASRDHLFLPRGMFLDLAKRWELLAIERQTLESEEPPYGRRSEAMLAQPLQILLGEPTA